MREETRATRHTGTYQASGPAPRLIVLTPELAVALDNLLAVAQRVAVDQEILARELATVQLLHDFERFNLGGEPR